MCSDGQDKVKIIDKVKGSKNKVFWFGDFIISVQMVNIKQKPLSGTVYGKLLKSRGWIK